MPDHHDDDPTPARRGPALSPEALNLLDLALAINGVAVTLREAARRLDEADPGARERISVAIEFQLAEVRDSCTEALAALKAAR